MTVFGPEFLDQSRRYLRDEYLPKIDASLDRLSEEEVWWRPNETSNSVGNLVLHLAGNVRQWIVSGVGGAPDTRRREEEFDERGPLPVAELDARLRGVLAEADDVLERFDPADLGASRRIQGRDVTVLAAIYHVVEHFGMHTGQIVYVTKHLLGIDLAFYREDGARRPWW